MSLLLIVALLLAPLQAAERVIYYHQDLQGSTVAATDAQGQLLFREAYAPYGERTLKQDGGINPIWYTGKPHHEDFGLTYLGARWYDPALGRFLVVDPVDFTESNPVSFNRYAYANNSPYNYIDPDGRFPIVLAAPWIGEILVAAVGSLVGVTAVTIYNESKTQKSGDKPSSTDTSKSTGGRRKLGPVADADGPHTTWKKDPSTGDITRHETWKPNSRNPTGWDSKQSTDLTGRPHRNKLTGESVPTPHTQGKGIPGGARPAEPREIPRRQKKEA